MMEDFDRALFRYVVRWAPFGGVPEDEVLPRFGLMPSDFRARVEELSARFSSGRPFLALADQALVANVRALIRSKHPLLRSEAVPPSSAKPRAGRSSVEREANTA